MANFRKINSGWQARISYKDIHGKYHQKTKAGFTNKRDATKWANEQELYLKPGMDKSHGTLLSYFDSWYEIYKKPSVTYRTQMTYTHSKAIISKYFGKTALQDIDTDAVQEFINAYAKGTSPFGKKHAKESVQKVFTHLSGALKKATKDGIYRYNPAEDVKVIGEVAPRAERLKYLDESDQLKLRKYILANLHPTAPVMYMILTALDTGMRLGELLGLPWENVSESSIFVNQAFDYSSMAMVTTKNDNPRTITITSELYQILSQMKRRDLVFASKLNEPLSSSFVSREFRHIQEQAGIEDPINFHGLRHSHASLLLFKGANVKFIAKRLGHRDIQTTLRVYSHILSEMDKEENDLVQSMIENQYQLAE